MSNLDFDKILADSISVAKQNIGSAWSKVEPFAEHEFRQFAEDAEFLAKLRLLDQIDDATLIHRLDMQKLALKNVLLTIEGIGLITAQNTVNAIIGIVSKAIGSALNISLPV